MVLQVFSHGGVVVEDGDVVFLEDGGGTDAGEFEQLRRLKRSGCEEDLFRCVYCVGIAVRGVIEAISDEVCIGGFEGLEVDFRDEGIGQDFEVWSIGGEGVVCVSGITPCIIFVE